MAAKVKSKIQRLLRQLDQDDDGASGADAAAQLLGEYTEQPSTVATDLNAAFEASAGMGSSAADLEASDSSIGFGGETPMDDSMAATPSISSLETTPSQPRRQPLPRQYAAAANAEKLAGMERKAMQLMADNRNLQAAFAEAMARKNAEVAELQASGERA